jgi:hypothetical protein
VMTFLHVLLRREWIHPADRVIFGRHDAYSCRTTKVRELVKMSLLLFFLFQGQNPSYW